MCDYFRGRLNTGRGFEVVRPVDNLVEVLHPMEELNLVGSTVPGEVVHTVHHFILVGLTVPGEVRPRGAKSIVV